jgi:U3 small nucleolar RNA-associated protein 7
MSKYDKSVKLPASKSKRPNKKLASHLATLDKAHTATRAAAEEHDHFLLPGDNAGLLEAETDLERTWRVSQDEIKASIGTSAASKGFNLDLPDFGPYALDYTSNGRHLAIAGRKGHVATFDWQTGKLHTELQLNETARDIW